MPLKRTNVYADAEDLAVIKEAATREGLSEAEIIREAIHLTALAHRAWDEPFFSRTFPTRGSAVDHADEVLDDVYRDKAAEYDRYKTNT